MGAGTPALHHILLSPVTRTRRYFLRGTALPKMVRALDDAVTPADSDALRLFDGPGEMRARCRTFDWSSTPLGPVSGWSQSLRTTVSIMLASLHPMFLWWGPELIQIFNDGYLPSFGTSGRDKAALGARGHDHWLEIWPIIGPQIEAVLNNAEATWHEDQLVPIERNGHVENVWWTYGFSPVRDDDGSVRGVLVVVQETTARVLAMAERELLLAAERVARAEAESAREDLSGVFAAAPVAIAVLQGRELRYSAANPKYRQIIGDRNPEGLRLVEMFPDLAGSEIEGILEQVFDTATAFAATDFHIAFDSQGAGTIDNYYDVVYHPLLHSDGSVRGIVVVAVDVTDRHNRIIERERLLKSADQAREEAVSANRAKSEFLAVMSHELRTPLNSIGGHAELIELGIHGPVTPEQATALARIQQSQRHLLGLINGVLNYSRVQAGAVHYTVTDVPMDEVIATCEALMAPQVTARGLALHYEGCSLELNASADREKVQQIVLNLVSNAVKFTEPGGSITIECEGRSNGFIAVSVTDTGHGIATDQIERVFQPFIQVDARLTRTQEGTGLGLAISRDLARKMGGDLTATSQLGVGSRFVLTLPAGSV